MTLRKITDADLNGMGVVGMADTPNLSALEMQEKVEEVVRRVVIPVLNENIDYTVSKEELAETVFNSGSGDMLTAKYDGNKDGCVDCADNGFFTYIHSGKTLTGSGINGTFKATATGTYTSFTVGGASYAVKAGSENEIELTNGVWYSFIIDSGAKTINFKSGGAALNFKVVGGTTQPASPKENTVWINTSAAIGEYQFSAAQPSKRTTGAELVSGDVWIKTGITSNVAFNALKKNLIEIRPVGCYQWNGSSWAQKEMQSYIAGSWTSFYKYLFSDGAAQVPWNVHVESGLVTGGVSNGTIFFGCSLTSDGEISGNGSYHTGLIDLTNISYIYFNVTKYEVNNSSNFAPCGYISKRANEYFNSGARAAQVNLTSAGLKTLDVRNFTGTYYIGMTAWNTYTDGSKIYSYVYLDKVYMI